MSCPEKPPTEHEKPAKTSVQQPTNQLPVHLMFSEGNPWCCSCPVLYAFIAELHGMEGGGDKCWNVKNCSLLTDDTMSCVKGVTIPCYSPKIFQGVNLASAAQVVTKFNDVCCNQSGSVLVDECASGGGENLWNVTKSKVQCAFAGDWVRNNSGGSGCSGFQNSGSSDVEVEGKSSENTTTLIGIFIVISIPLFLTFLPSGCEKKDKVESEFLLSTAIGVTLAHHKIAAASNSTANSFSSK